MKSFAMAIALLASVNTFAQVVYTDSADLSSSTHSFAIVGAQYKKIATKVEERKVPGCTITSENYPETCTEVVAVESTPVVEVNVSYVDSSFVSEGQNLSYATFTFNVADFDAADVAALVGKNEFSRAGRNFAKKYFTLSVKREARKISVVDVRNSKLCISSGDNYPEVEAGCVENLVYKSATIYVNEVNLIQK